MKCETIKYDDDSKVIIIDDAVNIEKRINIYYDCCVLPYRIINSSVNDIQGLADRRLKSDLDHEHPIIEHLLGEGSGSFNVIKNMFLQNLMVLIEHMLIWEYIAI